jgi:hypothetical protein
LPFIYRMPRAIAPGKYRVVMALSADEGLFAHTEEEELVVEAAPVKEVKAPVKKPAPKKSN